jgi:hypothetical protein
VAIPAVHRLAADAVAHCSAEASAFQDSIGHTPIIAAVPRRRGPAGADDPESARPPRRRGAGVRCTLAR